MRYTKKTAQLLVE